MSDPVFVQSWRYHESEWDLKFAGAIECRRLDLVDFVDAKTAKDLSERKLV